MEPYPKSKAKDLHQNEIEIENEVRGRVSFVPFLGIAPFRYRDIFQKTGKRKNDEGIAKRWMAGIETPMIENSSNSYIEIEIDQVTSLFGEYIVDEETPPDTDTSGGRPQPAGGPAAPGAIG